MIGETAKAMGAKRARNAMRVCETELQFLKERFFVIEKNSITYYVAAFWGYKQKQTTINFQTE